MRTTTESLAPFLATRAGPRNVCGSLDRLSGHRRHPCSRTTGVSGSDIDPNFSTQAGGDEWFPNVTGETPPADTEFQVSSPFDPSHSGIPPARHCPTLHGVMVSLLAKARDSDPTYRGPAAQGYKLMDSTATAVTPGNYRRRVQTLKINLRNYAVQN